MIILLEKLISTLGSESEIAINWWKDNHIIVNSGKFQAIISNQLKRNHTNEKKKVLTNTKCQILIIAL